MVRKAVRSRGCKGWETPDRQPSGPGFALTKVPITGLIVGPGSENQPHQLFRNTNPGTRHIPEAPWHYACAYRLENKPAQLQKRILRREKKILEV